MRCFQETEGKSEVCEDSWRSVPLRPLHRAESWWGRDKQLWPLGGGWRRGRVLCVMCNLLLPAQKPTAHFTFCSETCWFPAFFK